MPQPLRGSATRQSVRKLRRERIQQGRSPAGFASKPLQECNLKNLETLRLKPLKTMKSCPSHCETSATRQSLRKLRRERIRKGRAPAGFASKPLRNCNLKNLETLLLEPLKTMKSCPSHCETSATRQSLRKLRRERIRKGRAPAGFASKPLRNCNLKNFETLLLEPLKTMKSCPSHCETAATRQSPRKLRRERIRKGRAPAGFASKPLQEYSLKNLETLLLEHLKTMKSCPSHCEGQPPSKRKKAASGAHPKRLRRERIRKGRAPAGFASKPLRNCNLKNFETLLLEPLKTMKSCPSHCETSATRQSLRKLRRERVRKGRAPAGFASKPLRNCNLKNLETLLLEPLKTMKSCPSHCETSATRQSPRKLRRERIRKGRAPAGFASKPLRNCNLKNLETLLLEPLKTMKSCASHCQTSATRQSLRKLRRERIRKGRAPAGFASKPLRNCNLKNFETLLLEPLKTMKSCPSHCETAATRQSPRKLRRERIRKGKAPAGFASKPLQEYSLKNLETLLLGTSKNNENVPQPLRGSATSQSVRKLRRGAHPKRMRRERIRKGRAPAGFASKPLRNCNLKNLETLLLEPLKTMKSCPSHCETAATRQSLRKLRRERIRKGRAPAGFASKPLRNCNLKNLETLLLEPLKTMKSCPSHCETAATQAKPKKAASGAHPKKQSPSRFCVRAIAGVQPQKSRNVAFGTPKNNEIVPQPLRGSATRQSPRKLRRERIRKGRAPAGFASKPLQERNLKNLETLLLEPLKTMKSCPIKTMKTCLSHCETSASLCKHHVDTADAKRPKHHLDTSQKPPKPQAIKLLHVTFGIHIKQKQCPAYANSIWTLQMQKDQTPSEHEPWSTL